MYKAIKQALLSNTMHIDKHFGVQLAQWYFHDVIGILLMCLPPIAFIVYAVYEIFKIRHVQTRVINKRRKAHIATIVVSCLSLLLLTYEGLYDFTQHSTNSKLVNTYIVNRGYVQEYKLTVNSRRTLIKPEYVYKVYKATSNKRFSHCRLVSTYKSSIGQDFQSKISIK